MGDRKRVKVTPAELLSDALAALENHPESVWVDPNPMHPEDAYITASTMLATVAGLRTAEWRAARDG